MPPPRIGKRNRSGSQDQLESLGNATTPSVKPSQSSDSISLSGTQPPRPQVKRRRPALEPSSADENVDERPVLSLREDETSAAYQPTYPPFPQIQPDLEASFTAGLLELCPSSATCVEETPSNSSQPTYLPEPVLPYVDEITPCSSQSTYLPTPQTPPNPEASTADDSHRRPLLSPCVDEGSASTPHTTYPPTIQVMANIGPSSTGESLQTLPAFRKRSYAEDQTFSVNIRRVSAPLLPPTKRAKVETGGAVSIQPPTNGNVQVAIQPTDGSQTRYGVPSHRRKNRVPKETLMLLVRTSRLSAPETTLEMAGPQSASGSIPSDTISPHSESAKLANTNGGEELPLSRDRWC